MAKNKTAFVCQSCGSVQPKWQGQCSDCQAWNSLVESRAPRVPSARPAGYAGAGDGQIQRLAEIVTEEKARIATPLGEVDRVLGGGLQL